ncbi:uncharacterized protein LOC112487187 [Cynoglossus semilaevis]|uniref:uncharacterized protein LOC112487187 n=1 Tax=Cynoglossus semilaevis TaxID=244447 RepID=UPI000D623F50|nr:uncharacterized protein LOC112487187 [Cynoglossus semilaevis]
MTVSARTWSPLTRNAAPNHYRISSNGLLRVSNRNLRQQSSCPVTLTFLIKNKTSVRHSWSSHPITFHRHVPAHHMKEICKLTLTKNLKHIHSQRSGAPMLDHHVQDVLNHHLTTVIKTHTQTDVENIYSKVDVGTVTLWDRTRKQSKGCSRPPTSGGSIQQNNVPCHKGNNGASVNTTSTWTKLSEGCLQYLVLLKDRESLPHFTAAVSVHSPIHVSWSSEV